MNKAFEMTNYHISNEQQTTRLNTRLEELNGGAQDVLSDAVPVSQDGVFNFDGDIVGTAPSIRFDRVANLSDTINQTMRTGKHTRDILISNFVGFSSIFSVFSCF